MNDNIYCNNGFYDPSEVASKQIETIKCIEQGYGRLIELSIELIEKAQSGELNIIRKKKKEKKKIVKNYKSQLDYLNSNRQEKIANRNKRAANREKRIARMTKRFKKMQEKSFFEFGGWSLEDQEAIKQECLVLIRKYNLNCGVEVVMHYLNWPLISRVEKLSENFISKFKKYVDWYWICQSQELSEEFICKHRRYVNWSLISECQNLSENFIRENRYSIDADSLLKNPNVTTEFKNKLTKAMDIAYKRQNAYTISLVDRID